MLNDKTKENRLRRRLKKYDCFLSKSRIKYINADNFGEYMILSSFNGMVMEGERFQLSLDDVEQILDEWDEVNKEEQVS